MPSYIETFTGKRFFPLSPDGADVCIEDIAQVEHSFIQRFKKLTAKL